ncbi:MAG: hypothetical protein RIB60_04065 [Phycisphaerales bacterium]
MSTYELIEQAVLDALGILEPEERDAFEAALAGAAPDVRAQVREEQERLLDLEDLLPDESPRPELRDLVLAAVRAAITDEEKAGTPVVAKLSPGSAPVVREPRPAFRPAKRVSRMWRAAAVALGAAFIGMSAIMLEVQGLYSEASSRATFDEVYESAGSAANKILFGAECTKVVMTSVTDADGANGPQAAVWKDPDWDTARLLLNRVKTNPGENLRLVVIDDSGEIVEEVRRFQSTGELTEIRVQIKDVGPQHNLAIFREDDQLLMRSFLSEM